VNISLQKAILKTSESLRSYEATKSRLPRGRTAAYAS